MACLFALVGLGGCLDAGTGELHEEDISLTVAGETRCEEAEASQHRLIPAWMPSVLYSHDLGPWLGTGERYRYVEFEWARPPDRMRSVQIEADWDAQPGFSELRFILADPDGVRRNLATTTGAPPVSWTIDAAEISNATSPEFHVRVTAPNTYVPATGAGAGVVVLASDVEIEVRQFYTDC